LCQDVIECLRVLAEERNQTLTLDAPVEMTAMIDCDTLRLALINLIANAIRYTQTGGQIRVCLRQLDERRVAVDVDDNGPGIATQHRERVFERFYRVDQSRSHGTGGSGLGLAIARWAIEANGGHLGLESKAEAGSLFRTVLPAG